MVSKIRQIYSQIPMKMSFLESNSNVRQSAVGYTDVEFGYKFSGLRMI